jgi:hypothetical protein
MNPDQINADSLDTTYQADKIGFDLLRMRPSDTSSFDPERKWLGR